MVTEKDIEKQGLKMGYKGKITPYIRKRIIDAIKANKDNQIDKVDDKIDDIKKSVSSSKSVNKSKKKHGNTVKRIKSGISKTRNYLIGCGERYDKYGTDEYVLPVKKAKKKPVKGKRTKQIKKTKKKSVKQMSSKQASKKQHDIQKELMGWM